MCFLSSIWTEQQITNSHTGAILKWVRVGMTVPEQGNLSNCISVLTLASDNTGFYEIYQIQAAPFQKRFIGKDKVLSPEIWLIKFSSEK